MKLVRYNVRENIEIGMEELNHFIFRTFYKAQVTDVDLEIFALKYAVVWNYEVGTADLHSVWIRFSDTYMSNLV